MTPSPLPAVRCCSPCRFLKTGRNDERRGLTADWEVYPAGPWKYALVDAPLTHAEHPISPIPFSRRTPPMTVSATAVRAPDWVEAHGGYADPPPYRPLRLAGANPETISLIRYGAAKLRVTAMPVTRV